MGPRVFEWSIPREKMVKDIRELAEKLWHDQMSVIKGGKCVFYSAATMMHFKCLGIQCYLQAGSMSWPCIKMEEDDGVSPTHFSFEWEGYTQANVMRMVSGALPEMHVWVGIPETNEIVDLSVGTLPEQAKEIAKIEWKGPRPPNFLWTNVLPENVRYVPEKGATTLAYKLIFSMFATIRKG